MKNNSLSITLLLSVFMLNSFSSLCQKNKSTPLDSALEANSEKWKVKKRNGLFGMGKPEFGPYATTDAGKLDSPAIKKRTKDSAETGVTISSNGWDWDLGKFETVEKTKSYRIAVANGLDSVQLRFTIYAVSNQRTQTVLGSLLSKNDEGKDYVLGYVKHIAGFIEGLYAQPWPFLIEDYLTDKQLSYSPTRSDTTKFRLLTPADSLYSEAIFRSIGKRGPESFLEWQEGVFVNNRKGEHIAALKFAEGINPASYVWIRKDLNKADQLAIASLFAVLIATMRL